MTLSWDPKNVNANARQLVESCVVIMNSIERQLKNDLAGLPEMPPAVALDVRASLDHTIGGVAQQRAGIAQLGNWLKKRTSYAVDADRFVAKLPWYYRIPEATRFDGPGGGILPGLLSGTGDMAAGLGTIGGIGLENNRLTGSMYTAFLGHLGQPSPTDTTVAGLKASAKDPKAALKAMTRYDLLKERRFGEWTGYMTPGAVLSALTGGAGATTRVAAVTKVHKSKIPTPRPTRIQATKSTAGAIGRHAKLSTLDALTVGMTDIALTLQRLWSRVGSVGGATRRVAIADNQLSKAPGNLQAAQAKLQEVHNTLKGRWAQPVRRESTSRGNRTYPDRAERIAWKNKMSSRKWTAETAVQQAQLRLDGMPARVRAAEANLNRRQQLLAAQIQDELVHHSIHGALRVESFASALEHDDD